MVRLTAMSVSALAMMPSTRCFVLPLKPPLAPITRCLTRTRCQRISSRTHPGRSTAAAVTHHVAAASPDSPSSPSSSVLGRGREVRCNAPAEYSCCSSSSTRRSSAPTRILDWNCACCTCCRLRNVAYFHHLTFISYPAVTHTTAVLSLPSVTACIASIIPAGYLLFRTSCGAVFCAGNKVVRGHGLPVDRSVED